MNITNNINDALLHNDLFKIKTYVALGVKVNEIKKIAKECLKQNPNQADDIKKIRIELKNWFKSIKVKYTTESLLTEIFRKSPDEAESAIQFFISAGGQEVQLNNFLEKHLPKEASKSVLYLETIRRITSHCSSETTSIFHKKIMESQPFQLLHFACRDEFIDLISELIQHGLDLNNATFPGGFSPLHTAASYGKTKSISYLLSQGASVDALTGVKETPLHMAISEGHYEAVEILLHNGADPEKCSNAGNNALHYACEKGSIPIIKLLLSNKDKLDIKNKEKLTPFQIARSNGNQEIIKLLS